MTAGSRRMKSCRIGRIPDIRGIPVAGSRARPPTTRSFEHAAVTQHLSPDVQYRRHAVARREALVTRSRRAARCGGMRSVR
jgi:hypothetical protein